MKIRIATFDDLPEDKATKIQSLYRGYSVRNNNQYRTEEYKVLIDIKAREIIHNHLHDTGAFFDSVPTAILLNSSVFFKVFCFIKCFYDTYQMRKTQTNFLHLKSGNCAELSVMLYLKIYNDPSLSPEIKANLRIARLTPELKNDHQFLLIYQLKKGVSLNDVFWSSRLLARDFLFRSPEFTDRFDLKNSFVIDPWIKFINLKITQGYRPTQSNSFDPNRHFGFFGSLDKYQAFLKSHSKKLGFKKNINQEVPIEITWYSSSELLIEQIEMRRLGICS